MDVSIIMPTYNKSKYLDLTLASFLNQTHNNFEIIIIDDGSNDNTKEIVNKYQNKLNINYIFQENRGRANARNTGLDYCKGDFIVFSDDDRIVHPNFIKEHIIELQNGDEKTVIIGWKHNILSFYDPEFNINNKDYNYLIKNNPNLTILFESSEKIQLLNDNNIINYNEKDLNKLIVHDSYDNFMSIINHYGYNLEGFQFKWIIGTTANMSINRTFALNVGEFDGNFKGWGMEDTDFSYRLAKQDGVFKISKKAFSLHQYHSRENLRETLIKNIIYFVRKYKNLDCLLYHRCYGEKKIGIIDANDIYSSVVNKKALLDELTGVYYDKFLYEINR